MLRVLGRFGAEVGRTVSTSSASAASLVMKNAKQEDNLSAEQIWERRSKLRIPKLQKDEQLSSKVYFAPEWELDKKANRDEGHPDPLKDYGMTPEKWRYYNKVVWPPNYVVPETGLAKTKEVFYVQENIHFSPKRMWTACQLVWKMNVDEALTQLDLQQLKSCSLLAETLKKAKKQAADELHIEFPSQMYIADAFPVQSNVVKGARRHAHEDWNTIRYRYINIFVRLESGPPPSHKQRFAPKNGYDHMNSYYDYLRSRTIKYSI